MIALVVFHVTVALAGVACSTIAFFAPTKARISCTYGFIALTLVSGTYLVISTHAAILHSCVSGLVYVGIVSAGALAAHRKLARQTVVAATDKAR